MVHAGFLLFKEASINALNKRLPFENMAFVTIVADEKNLEGETVAHPDRYKSLRIDNPLCNGNPKAKIFAIQEVRDRFSIWHIDYNPKDGYWREFPSTISNVGISPIQILNEGQKNGYGQDVAAVIK